MVDLERYNALMAQSAVDRDNAALFAELGLMAVELGRHEESVQFLKRALKLNPSLTHLIEPLRRVASPAELAGLAEFMPARPFAETWIGAFRYPLTGMGIYMLIGGGVIFGLGRAGAFFFPLPSLELRMVIGAIFWVLLWGYLWSYLFDVVVKTTKALDTPPEWTDLLDPFGMWREAARAAGAALAALLPLAAFALAAIHPAAGIAAGALAVIYAAVVLPMSILANAMFGNPVAAFDLPHVWRSIRASWPDYRLTIPISLALLFAAVPAVASGFMLAAGDFKVFVMISVASASNVYTTLALMGLSLFEVYCGMVLARMLGLFFHANQSKLNWFGSLPTQ